MKDSIALAWEKRGKLYLDKLEGVLPKSFPKFINSYLDQWMYFQIRDSIENRLKKIRVLDLGCGYGRLSQKILIDFPHSRTIGIDISLPYVNLYNKNLKPRGKAILGTMVSLPFKDSSFDYVIVVTALMYLTKKSDRKKAFKQISRVLKPNGKIIMIERNESGYKLVTIWGLVNLLRGKTKREITAVSFKKRELDSLFKAYNFKILTRNAIPISSFFLLFLIILSYFNKNISIKLLNITTKGDKYFSWLLTPSMYISYIGLKND